MSEEEEKKPYGFTGRMIMFLVIAGPGSLLAFGVWARIGLRASTTATARPDASLNWLFWAWLFGIVSSAIMVFKR